MSTHNVSTVCHSPWYIKGKGLCHCQVPPPQFVLPLPPVAPSVDDEITALYEDKVVVTIGQFESHTSTEFSEDPDLEIIYSTIVEMTSDIGTGVINDTHDSISWIFYIILALIIIAVVGLVIVYILKRRMCNGNYNIFKFRRNTIEADDCGITVTMENMNDTADVHLDTEVTAQNSVTK
ncbi:uncharacterized protein LOC144352776 [Saccoglossus kowalevskii]